MIQVATFSCTSFDYYRRVNEENMIYESLKVCIVNGNDNVYKVEFSKCPFTVPTLYIYNDSKCIFETKLDLLSINISDKRIIISASIHQSENHSTCRIEVKDDKKNAVILSVYFYEQYEEV